MQRLAYSFGSPNYLTESSTCAEAMLLAQKLTYGTPAPPDLKNAQCLLAWGVNPFYANTTLARKIIMFKERGGKLIAVDPRVTPMARQADLHLQLKPGSDGALALTMAQVIINERLYDGDFVENYTYGFQEFSQYVQGFTLERGESLTGVPAAIIKEAAFLYAGIKPAAIMPSAASVVHHTNGVQNYRAVFALAGLTGNYDIPGGNFVDPASILKVPGGFPSREAEFAHVNIPGDGAAKIGAERFPVWAELVDQGQAMHLPEQIETGKPYPIKALLGFGLNYRMWPDSERMAEALKNLDFFVDIDIFQTDSSKLADIILPACTSVERSELRCYPERYIIYTQPVIPPLYESRSDADIIFDLAKKLKLRDPWLEAGYEAALDYILEPSGITLRELKRFPMGMPVPQPMPIPARKYQKAGFATPSGKLEFKSLVLEKYAKDYGYTGLPVYIPPRYSAELTPERARDYPFILNTGSRLPMFIHTRTFRLPWTHSLRPEAAADLNPQDAQSLGIAQGDWIRLETPGRMIKVKANLTSMVQPGVVHMYHGYREADVNSLIEGDYLDPISGYPGFKGILCRVIKD